MKEWRRKEGRKERMDDDRRANNEQGQRAPTRIEEWDISRRNGVWQRREGRERGGLRGRERRTGLLRDVW